MSIRIENDQMISPIDRRAHTPVLLQEAITELLIKDNGLYLDCTFGAGGYSRAMLDSAKCNVIAFDRDKDVMPYVNEMRTAYGERFQFMNINFNEVGNVCAGQKFNGIVLDLGVSSMQLDRAERGFSFQQDGPLDMRMSTTGYSAADFVNSATEEEIANVIYNYGGETESRRIAARIVMARHNKPLSSTLELAQIVQDAKKIKKSRIDLATKTFQAIRIHVNDELGALNQFLNTAEELLDVGGRMIILSFHSLEDSIVKSFIRKHSLKKIARSKYAKDNSKQPEGKWLRSITPRPIVPSIKEMQNNIRSRSAKMRIVEKIETVGIYE